MRARVAALLVVVGVLAGCDGADGETPGDGGPIDTLQEVTASDAAAPDSDPPADERLRLNHLQVLGSHNSYHIASDWAAPDVDYTHPPLDVQLEDYGVRQLELDIYRTSEPGFRVLHSPIIDEQTTCATLAECLGLVESWSAAHPEHVPILVILEIKHAYNAGDADEVVATGYFDVLESAILALWPRERILTPDDVRGAHTTLRGALETDGWPTIVAVRGKAIFLLNVTSRVSYFRDAYLTVHPNLEGALMFVRDGMDEPWGAILERGNATNDFDAITAAIAQGYLVRTTADTPENDDATNEARRDAALRSGAHFISTDFLHAVDGREYWFRWPAEVPARCNPRAAPEPCADSDFEAP